MVEQAFYDGVPVIICENNQKGDLYLEVTKKMPWKDSPEPGEKFWVNGDDKYLNVIGG